MSRGYCCLWYTGLSLQRLLLLRSTGSRRTDFRGECAYSCLENSMDRGAWRATSVPGVTRLGQALANKSPLCEISPNQGSNSCLLYWQMDSYPLYPREVQEMHLLKILFGSSLLFLLTILLTPNKWLVVFFPTPNNSPILCGY